MAGYQTDPKEMEPDFTTFFELSAHIYPSLGHILASTLSLVKTVISLVPMFPLFFFVDYYFLFLKYFLGLLGGPYSKT